MRGGAAHGRGVPSGMMVMSQGAISAGLMGLPRRGLSAADAMDEHHGSPAGVRT